VSLFFPPLHLLRRCRLICAVQFCCMEGLSILCLLQSLVTCYGTGLFQLPSFLLLISPSR